jgi:hypothetical protein
LLAATASGQKGKIELALASWPEASASVRIYSVEGRLLGTRLAVWDHQVSFLSDSELERVKQRGETRDRFFKPAGQGLSTVVRSVLKDSRRLYGVVEAQIQIGQKELTDFKNRREIDTLLLNQDLTAGAASFALAPSFVQNFSKLPFKLPGEPVVVNLGDARFSSFLYELPAAYSRKQKSGYFVLFIAKFFDFIVPYDTTNVGLKCCSCINHSFYKPFNVLVGNQFIK